jgi:hypothetical protein
MALGASGIRPPVPLPGGRTIRIHVDFLVLQSLLGGLSPFFSPGPGVLDSNGEARGFLDVSTLPTLGGNPGKGGPRVRRQSIVSRSGDP